MIEWSWRLEGRRSINAGSWSSERGITIGVRSLKGRHLIGIAVVGRLPELVLQLSGGLWLHSFMTAEGQPEWAVFLRDGSWVTVEAGRLIHDTQNVGLTEASA